jgi:hypothetical protein
MEVSGQLHSRPLYPQGKSPWYPLDRRLGGPQSQSGHTAKTQTPDHLSHSISYIFMWLVLNMKYVKLYDHIQVLSLFLTEHYAMKVYWGSGGIAPCILVTVG